MPFMKSRPAKNRFVSNLEDAAALLRRGGVLLYPTETYYAIGCMANRNESVLLIYKIKMRPADKPMPVIAADCAQAALCARLSAAPQRLLDVFWPGPLTVILPAMDSLAPALQGPHNKVALRVSSSPIASSLANLCGFPLSASSANISGCRPVRTCGEISPRLLQAMEANNVDFGIFSGECPADSMPSTIVEPLDETSGCKLRILRHGAINQALLARENFEILL